MIAEYKLEYSGGSLSFLDDLKNPRKQRAEIVVFSQGYEAYSFPVCRFTDSLTKAWNQFAYWLQSKTETKEVVDGHDCVRYWIDLPRFIKLHRGAWRKAAFGRQLNWEQGVYLSLSHMPTLLQCYPNLL